MLYVLLAAAMVQGVNFPEYGSLRQVIAALRQLNKADENEKLPIYPEPPGYVRYRTRSGALIIERR